MVRRTRGDVGTGEIPVITVDANISAIIKSTIAKTTISRVMTAAFRMLSSE
jgi:hypothetical protein